MMGQVGHNFSAWKKPGQKSERVRAWTELTLGSCMAVPLLQHICCMGGVAGRPPLLVCPHWDQQSLQDFKTIQSRQALAWELPGFMVNGITLSTISPHDMHPTSGPPGVL